MKQVNGYWYEYHEKHKAWVISRPFDRVNLTGGSHFEPTWYESEQQVINELASREARDE